MRSVLIIFVYSKNITLTIKTDYKLPNRVDFSIVKSRAKYIYVYIFFLPCLQSCLEPKFTLRPNRKPFHIPSYLFLIFLRTTCVLITSHTIYNHHHSCYCNNVNDIHTHVIQQRIFTSN